VLDGIVDNVQQGLPHMVDPPAPDDLRIQLDALAFSHRPELQGFHTPRASWQLERLWIVGCFSSARLARRRA